MVTIITHTDYGEISKVMPINKPADIVTLSLSMEGIDIFNSLYIDSVFSKEGEFIENYALGSAISWIPDMFEWLNTPLNRIDI